ncbi:MAG TPA: hypothetical protein VL598_16070 [Trinickia sp.]|jgi:hypothetical protein|uniref:hypothetical protein n=1 Tax=Trinickia sp. TaxID=2571163 RepID=UPI002D091787|nr:hypothetical protein [Trinickia sp.]HTI19167.1 hypothetical protein [Trinickia sp.]
MKPTSSLAEALREAKIVEALSVARFALGTHDRLLHIREGQQIEMDFRYEIHKIDEALQLLGIDPARPPSAPLPQHDDSVGGDSVGDDTRNSRSSSQSMTSQQRQR